MFDRFGEMGSYEEINMAADGLLNEGDTKNIFVLAEENGIDREYAQAFIDGDIPLLCDAATAAVGKLDVEMKDGSAKKYRSEIPAEPIVEYLKAQAGDEKLAAAVRAKGKSLTECLAHVKAEAKKIVTRETPYLADAVVYKMARDYYLGGGER